MSGEIKLEKTDFLWSFQRAFDLAKQAGDDDLAEEIWDAASEMSEEEMNSLFRGVQYLYAGLQARKIEIGLPT